MMRLTFFAISAATAIATARYVLPVPAGPMPKVMSLCSMASTYLRWFGDLGCTMRLTPAERCFPLSTSDRRLVPASATTSFSMACSSPLCSVNPPFRRNS